MWPWNPNNLLLKASHKGDVEGVRSQLKRGADPNNSTDKDGNTALILAASSGHKEVVAALVWAGADVNVANKNNYTALILAAFNGHKEVVAALVAAGMDVNARNENGNTALILAADKGHTEAIAALVAAGADVNIANQNGTTPLMWAAHNGHKEMLAALVAAGADVNAANQFGNTPLILAAMNGHKEVVAALVVVGADVSARNQNDDTPLILAADKGHNEMVAALVAAGADVNAANQHRNTALILASYNGHMEIVATLVAAGADVNARGQHGNTALNLAASNGHTGVVAALVAAGAGAEAPARNKDGNTTLILAAYKGHTDVVAALVAAGVDVNVANKNGDTALICAADKGHKEVVAALVAAGADVNAAKKNGDVALICAAYKGHKEVVAALVAAGADANAAKKNGDTALILAADRGHKEVVASLVAAAGVDVNAANQNGNTALILAAINGHTQVVDALLAAGADVRKKNKDGNTPLTLADAKGHEGVVGALYAAASTQWSTQNKAAVQQQQKELVTMKAESKHKAAGQEGEKVLVTMAAEAKHTDHTQVYQGGDMELNGIAPAEARDLNAKLALVGVKVSLTAVGAVVTANPVMLLKTAAVVIEFFKDTGEAAIYCKRKVRRVSTRVRGLMPLVHLLQESFSSTSSPIEMKVARSISDTIALLLTVLLMLRELILKFAQPKKALVYHVVSFLSSQGYKEQFDELDDELQKYLNTLSTLLSAAGLMATQVRHRWMQLLLSAALIRTGEAQVDAAVAQCSTHGHTGAAQVDAAVAQWPCRWGTGGCSCCSVQHSWPHRCSTGGCWWGTGGRRCCSVQHSSPHVATQAAAIPSCATWQAEDREDHRKDLQDLQSQVLAVMGGVEGLQQQLVEQQEVVQGQVVTLQHVADWLQQMNAGNDEIVNHLDRMEGKIDDIQGGVDQTKIMVEEILSFMKHGYAQGQSTRRQPQFLISRSHIKIEEDALKRGSSGSYGTVVQAQRDGGPVALKLYNCTQLREIDQRAAMKEALILHRANHHNIVHCFGIVYDPDAPERDSLQGSLVMEWVGGGNLYKGLPHDTPLLVRVNLLFQVSAGMRHLHQQRIIHGDLKPQNILLSTSLERAGDSLTQIKICDFGLSLYSSSTMTQQTVQSSCTLEYSSPQRLSTWEPSYEDDVYAFGILVYYVATSSLPYPRINQNQLLHAVSSGARPDIDTWMVGDWADEAQRQMARAVGGIAKECWQEAAEKRPTFDAIYGRLNALRERL